MTHETYALTIDQGTTSSRAIISDHNDCVESVGQKEYEQILPRPGWVEHNPMEIWLDVREVLGLALVNVTTKIGHEVNHHDIAAVSITNQRETTIVWDRYTDQPVYNAIVWQDTRSQGLVDRLATNGGPDRQRSIVSETLSTYVSIIKLAWILENVPEARERVERGDSLFGSPDIWVIQSLTDGINGGIYITDVTNTSRAMLMNLHTFKWREDIYQEADTPMSMLPEIRPSSEVYGKCRQDGLLAGIKLAGDLGDQWAATFGQACSKPGTAKNTCGTGCFMLMSIGTKSQLPENGMITIVCYKIGDEAPVYALEGSIVVAGPLVQWLRDSLKVVDGTPECDTLAESVQDNGGVYSVPAFPGLSAPYWWGDARSAIVGMTRYNTRGYLARATLEATAHQAHETLDAMEADSGVELGELRVDGSMTKSDILMQFQLGMLGVPMALPQITETMTLGATYAAGIATEYWFGTQDAISNQQGQQRWSPQMSAKKRDRNLRLWKKAISRIFDWADKNVK